MCRVAIRNFEKLEVVFKKPGHCVHKPGSVASIEKKLDGGR